MTIVLVTIYKIIIVLLIIVTGTAAHLIIPSSPAINPTVGVGDESQSVIFKRGPLLINLITHPIAIDNKRKLANCHDLNEEEKVVKG